MSFHVGHIRSQKQAQIYFSNLLTQVRQTLSFLLAKKQPDYIKLFMQNIRQSEVGCMEVRLSYALFYVGSLKSNGSILPLDNLMENFSREVSNELQDLTVFKSALNYFAHYVNIQYPVSINSEIVPISWPIIKRYLKDVLYYDDIDESWQNLLTVLDKPINVRNTNRYSQEWFLFEFNTERAANLYLNFVKSVLPDFQEELNLARVIQTRSGTYRFRLTEKQFHVFLNIQEQINDGEISREERKLETLRLPPKKVLRTGKLNTPPGRYLVKSIRADESCFIQLFTSGITRSEKQNPETSLRLNRKLNYTVDASGVHERADKQPAYSKEQKQGFSPYQSTTLVTDEIRPPIFGFNKTRENKLVGVVINIKDALLGRLFIYDMGTIGRPYDFETKKAAEEYYGRKVDKSLFADIDRFEEVLKKPENRDECNEILARLRWNIDGSSAVCIFNDTLEARLLAQEYARILRSQLRAQFQENCKPWDTDYFVPICFYSRNKENKLFKPYTSEEQLQDIEKGKKIFENKSEREKYIKAKDFEFLLALEDSHEVFTATHQNGPLIFQLLKAGYWHILEALIQRDSRPDQTKQLLVNSVNKLENFMVKYYRMPSLITFTWLKMLGVDLNFREPGTENTVLIEASKAGHLGVIRNLLIIGKVDINLQNREGCTALMYAAHNGHKEIVKCLLKAGAKVNLRKENGWTALMYAARNGHKEIVKFLLDAGANVNLDAGADVNLRKENGWTALMLAARNGNKEIVKCLLNAGAKVNLRKENGWTALMLAARYGHKEIVKCLLKAGAKVNLRKENGWTALMYGARNGHKEIVKFLLDVGAEVNLQGEDGWTALMHAAHNGHEKIVKFLLDAGAEVNLQKADGGTTLMLAARNGHKEIVKFLLDVEADVNLRKENGRTALTHAAHYGHEKIVKFLLDAGAKVNLQEENDWTALMLAAHNGHKEIVKLLLIAEAEVNLKDRNDWSALMYAARYGHKEIVKCLLKAGAEVNLRKEYGWTALMHAVYYGHEKIVKLLLDAGAEVNLLNKKRKTAYDLTDLTMDQSLRRLLYPARVKLRLYCSKRKDRFFGYSEVKLEAANALIRLIDGEEINLKQHQAQFKNGRLKRMYEKILQSNYKTVIEKGLEFPTKGTLNKI